MGTFGRVVFWIGLVIIVGHAALTALANGNLLYALLALIFTPVTYFVWPFMSGLWWLLFVSLAGYWMSTTAGHKPVE